MVRIFPLSDGHARRADQRTDFNQQVCRSCFGHDGEDTIAETVDFLMSSKSISNFGPNAEADLWEWKYH